MKKTIGIIAIVLVALAGCSQQRQEPKGKQAAPGPVMMRSPEEIRQLEQIAKQAPKNATAWAMLGDALMDSSRFSEAVDAYQKSLALDPKNVNVRVDMGTCLKNIGKPQQAVEEYRKALAIDPNHLNAHHNMGVVLAFDLKDKQGAIKAFEKYLTIAPNAPNAAGVRQLIDNLKSGQ
jgi:tetratricopeptide (TPR) repeat protein